jgi:hypothetical protein
MALAAGHTGHSSSEITPVTFHARIDILLAGCGVFRIHPIGQMFSGIGIKGLIVRRSASGKGHESDERQEAVPSYHHYL